MTDSNWGTWLIDAIEAAEPTGLAAWYLGCNGLALRAGDGTTLYVDPYLGLGDPPRTVRMLPVPFDPTAPSAADAVLVTHEHTDHLHGPTQGPLLATTGATLYGPPGVVALIHERDWLDRYGIDASQVTAIEAGETIDVGGVTVGAHPCHDPDAAHACTYRVAYDGATLVHAADGRPHADLADIGARFDVDVAVAAFGSRGMIPDKSTRVPAPTTWYNTENDVIEIASLLEATRLVPTHWDMWKGLTADPTSLVHHRRGFEHPARVDVVEIGDRFAVD